MLHLSWSIPRRKVTAYVDGTHRAAWLASREMSSLKSASERRDLLKAVYEEARGCVACPLHETRTNVVFGSGNADAELMFVGEAPGANEDQQGLPFVGQAGKLLEKLLGEIGMERGDVFIANTLKCRPPGNRDPYPHELDPAGISSTASSS